MHLEHIENNVAFAKEAAELSCLLVGGNLLSSMETHHVHAVSSWPLLGGGVWLQASASRRVSAETLGILFKRVRKQFFEDPFQVLNSKRGLKTYRGESSFQGTNRLDPVAGTVAEIWVCFF